MCIFEFGEVYGCWTYGTAKHPSLDPKQHVREEAATARAQVAQKLLKQFGSDRYQVWSIVATTLQVRLPPPERERERSSAGPPPSARERESERERYRRHHPAGPPPSARERESERERSSPPPCRYASPPPPFRRARDVSWPSTRMFSNVLECARGRIPQRGQAPCNNASKTESVCVYVRACVREREGEGERERACTDRASIQ